MLFAESFSGKFWGEIKNKDIVNDKVYSFQTFYTFTDNTYSLDIDCTENFNAFNIPHIYIKTVAGKQKYSESGTYTTQLKNGFSYIFFHNSTPFQVRKSFGYLQYKNNFLFIDGKNLIFQCFQNYFDNGNIQEIKNVVTSSFLSENKTKYTGDNFKYIHNDLLPWVEGVQGDGIGEWIEITFKVWAAKKGNLCFLVSNGYVDFNRTDLYYANNRVKKLQVVCNDYRVDFETELTDSPQFQLIKVPVIDIASGTTLTVRFIIKEVFKGDKYEDTCVNLIVPFQE